MSKKQLPTSDEVSKAIAGLMDKDAADSIIENKIVAVELPKAKPTMSEQMRKHRTKYAACVSYTNRLSLNNGDEVATLLQGATPEAVMRAAEILGGFEEGELTNRYAKLNKGQQRMNAGNRIRGLVKKGKILPADLESALA